MKTIACCCIPSSKNGKHAAAPSDTSGDETTDHEEATKQPILVVINLDRVLVHASSNIPKFAVPWDKPRQASTDLPFKIKLS